MHQPDLERVQTLLAEVVAQGDPRGTRLNEWECYQLLDALGIARGPAIFLPRQAGSRQREEWAAAARDLADSRGRLLVKICGRQLLHKTELGGVRVLDLRRTQTTAAGAPAIDPGAAVAEALAAAAASADAVAAGGQEEAIEGWLACGFVDHRPNVPGQELLLSVRQDPAFGPVVVIGIGGTLTEWYGRGSAGRSTVVMPAPGLTGDVVAAAVTGNPLLKLLVEPSRLYRQAPLPLDELTRVVLLLAELGTAFGCAEPHRLTMEELEINPAVASGGGLVALDGVGLVSRRKWPSLRRPLAKILPLLRPRSAVVMGASSKGVNPGRIILENLLRSEGPVRDGLAVIHPREISVAGVPCYPSCADLPGKVDLAVIAIPAEGALAAVKELVDTDRAESIILIPGGFAETGQKDLAAAIEAELARGHEGPSGGPVMVGGNCLGIVSRGQYNTFFIPLYKLPFHAGRGGNLALVSQSGAYLVTFASNYDGIIQPRAAISYGNQMDLTVGDFIHHFVGDDEVGVIACYVEGFQPGDGARCLAAIGEARRRGKRVVVFKAGKTPLGAKAAASHTASLAGDYAVASACLAAAGADVASTLDEFEDLIKTFTLLADRPPRGRRVGVLSNAGFECTAVTDALGDLALASFDATTRAALAAVLPEIAHRDNPVDATPMAGTEAYAAATAAILACPGVEAVILSAVPVTGALETLERSEGGAHREDITRPGALGNRWLSLLAGAAKPAVVVIDAGRLYDPLCRQIEAAGVPVFRKIDRAARALSAYCRVVGSKGNACASSGSSS